MVKVLGQSLQKPRLERVLKRHRPSNGVRVERLPTRDRLTHDALEGIRLLAEMVRTPTTPAQECLRLLNRRTRRWKEKAEKFQIP